MGPDLVLTASFVIRPELDEPVDINAVQLRFDHLTDDSGRNVYSAGAVFRGAGVVAIGSGELHYALLRVHGAPGVQPVGELAAESQAVLRRWIELPEQPGLPPPGATLLIAHHPGGQPLQLSHGQVIGHQPLTYTVNTAPGSSGGPCFDAGTLQPFGLHIGRLPRDHSSLSYGLSLDDLIADLVQRGVAGELFNRFA